jgi:hypothetical protein
VQSKVSAYCKGAQDAAQRNKEFARHLFGKLDLQLLRFAH